MKVFLISNFVVAIVCFISFVVATTRIEYGMLPKCEQTKSKEKSKVFWADAAHLLLKISLMSLCPLLNLLMIYICVFRYDELNRSVRKMTIDKIERKDIKNKEEVGVTK